MHISSVVSWPIAVIQIIWKCLILIIAKVILLSNGVYQISLLPNDIRYEALLVLLAPQDTHHLDVIFFNQLLHYLT